MLRKRKGYKILVNKTKKVELISTKYKKLNEMNKLPTYYSNRTIEK